jgi:transcriptional regulator with XRE-family HTH domain/mannose-6-phosphate isomerase-like protein (cupin superfamily)
VGESIGGRIKSLRQEQELTLAELAEKSKLSASHLSQVERDKSPPSLMTLASIAQALEINLRDLFESEGDQIHISRTTDVPEETDGTYPVARLPLTIPSSSWNLEVDRLTLHPEAPCLEFEPYPGEVLGFVLDGALALEIDDEQIELKAGDSIHYDANQPYRLCCGGDRPCSVIWCNSPPRYEKVANHETQVPDGKSFK